MVLVIAKPCITPTGKGSRYKITVRPRAWLLDHAMEVVAMYCIVFSDNKHQQLLAKALEGFAIDLAV